MPTTLKAPKSMPTTAQAFSRTPNPSLKPWGLRDHAFRLAAWLGGWLVGWVVRWVLGQAEWLPTKVITRLEVRAGEETLMLAVDARNVASRAIHHKWNLRGFPSSLLAQKIGRR